MLTGRLLLLLVVMTATLAHGRAAVVSPARSMTPTGQASWTRRLGTGVVPGLSRIGLLQRVTLRLPACRPTLCRGQTPARVAAAVVPGPLLTRLPPPVG